MTEEVLSITSLFASLALSSDKDQEWLKRRFDVLKDALRDTPMYQHIGREAKEEEVKVGIEMGIEKGLKEGKIAERQERLSSLQRKLVASIGLRFPSLMPLAQRQIMALDHPQKLEELVFQIILVHDVEDAEKILLQLTQDQSEAQ